VVADDTAFVRDRFKAVLETAGHRAIVVASGGELLARVKAEAADIDLILLDLRLPSANGVGIVRQLRRIDPHKPSVVVFSGTIATANEVRELATLGIAGYVNEYASLQNILPSLSPHLFPGTFNRRTGPRVTISTSVSYRVGNSIASAVSLNISRGGLAVRSTSPLPTGTPVRLRFRLPTGPELEVEALVTWADRGIGMGFSFRHLNHDQVSAVAAHVDGHFFTNRKA
jgi:uncharacterized protein (TIGR02266 family)